MFERVANEVHMSVACFLLYFLDRNLTNYQGCLPLVAGRKGTGFGPSDILTTKHNDCNNSMLLRRRKNKNKNRKQGQEFVNRGRPFNQSSFPGWAPVANWTQLRRSRKIYVITSMALFLSGADQHHSTTEKRLKERERNLLVTMPPFNNQGSEMNHSVPEK